MMRGNVGIAGLLPPAKLNSPYQIMDCQSGLPSVNRGRSSDRKMEPGELVD